MITAKFASKDQNWQNGTTTYWFALSGVDGGTEREFDDETFGIVDEAGSLSAVDCDGAPIGNQYIEQIVLRECKITKDLLSA